MAPIRPTCPRSRAASSIGRCAGQATRLWICIRSTRPPYQAAARASCTSPSWADGVQILSAMSTWPRWPSSASASSRSASPYIGEVSNRAMPAAIAARSARGAGPKPQPPRAAARCPAGPAVYSGKHKKHGMNLQIIASPAGAVLWVSGALPGSVHDKRAEWVWGCWPSWRPRAWSSWPIRATRAARTPSSPYRGENKPESQKTGQRSARGTAVIRRTRERPSMYRRTARQTQDEKGSLPALRWEWRRCRVRPISSNPVAVQ